MDVTQVKVEKHLLEDKISEALNTFTQTTDLDVKYLHLNVIYTLGAAYPNYIVEVKVEV